VVLVRWPRLVGVTWPERTWPALGALAATVEFPDLLARVGNAAAAFFRRFLLGAQACWWFVCCFLTGPLIRCRPEDRRFLWRVFLAGIFKRRKWRKLAAAPTPAVWLGHLERHVPFCAALVGEEREEFLGKLKGFIGTKPFFGAGGLEIDDEIRVVVAASAVRLIRKLDLSYYDRLKEIVVYPYDFVNPRSEYGVHLGEAHSFGTVVLSWPAVLRGLRDEHDGHETALHEFAHVLDLGDGGFDGTPVLRARADYAAWGQVMGAHFERLQSGDAESLRVLRAYGATDPAEFFAVATEAFFEKGELMRERAPDLYKVLREFYGFDPC